MGLGSWLLPRLAWLAGLLVVLAGVVLAWWWEARPPVPRPGTLPPAVAASARPAAPPAQPPSQPAPPAPAAPAPPASAAPAPLPYEEPTPAQMSGVELQAIDEALFSALREGGVEPAKVRLKVKSLPQGEVAVLEAGLAPGQAPQALRPGLERALASTKGRGQWQNQGRALVLQVYLNGQPTHLVRLEPAPEAKPPSPGPVLPPPARPEPRPLPPGERPTVALVIDDLGFQLEPVRRLLALDLPLTLAILPHAPHAREVAELARAHGYEVLVHLPMEPKSYPSLSPGKGALLTSMSSQELTRVTQEDLASVPGAVGANNHMGSRLTESPAALQPVLEVLRGQGLFFLDSMTSPRSQAYGLARRMGLATAQRDVFLDHDPTRSAVDWQVQRLIQLAQGQGRAIAIGHPHSSTIEALAAQAPRLRAALHLVPVSALLETPGPGHAPSGGAPSAGELDSAGGKP